jgi:uncharacterized OB-fold protein
METVNPCNVYGDAVPFRQGLFRLNPDGSGYLIGNRCHCCGVTFFPGREFCSACYRSSDLEDVRLDTTGTLYTFTIVSRARPDIKTPYMVGYIDLEKNGVRIFAPITGCRPEDLKIGMQMELVFGKMNRIPKDESDRNEVTYQFRPSGQPCSREGSL